ncbi:DUF1932 domain-containing protein [Kitasatospora sp. NPDC008115]|uniref:NAD(P)-dependent oxidoreductase n=1 Tax=Kitasatospora sp. NPDC008115 TaxID=3364022 RepID=UPI0036E9D1EF
MGAAVAACAASTGTRVLWCPAGRSEATVRRAAEAGLEPAADLGGLLERAEVVLSLCPPAAAEDVAREVAEFGFTGVYVEGNAISPDRVCRIGDLVGRSARAVLDGSVIGSPPAGGKRTRLFLSGPSDATALLTAMFGGTAVSTAVLGGEIGQASALKVSYSAYQKASRVLAALSYGLAQHHGVDQALLDVASKRSGSYLVETDYIAKTASRAWRWAPELEEAADTLRAAGLPDETLRAVAGTLRRWADAKDDGALSVEGSLEMLRSSGPYGKGKSVRPPT